MPSKIYCRNGSCRVNNDRAHKCAAYARKTCGPKVMTCGTCIHSWPLALDGSIPVFTESASDENPRGVIV